MVLVDEMDEMDGVDGVETAPGKDGTSLWVHLRLAPLPHFLPATLP